MTVKIDWQNTDLKMEYVPSSDDDYFQASNILDYEIISITYNGKPCPEIKNHVYKLLVNEILNPQD